MRRRSRLARAREPGGAADAVGGGRSVDGAAAVVHHAERDVEGGRHPSVPDPRTCASSPRGPIPTPRRARVYPTVDVAEGRMQKRRTVVRNSPSPASLLRQYDDDVSSSSTRAARQGAGGIVERGARGTRTTLPLIFQTVGHVQAAPLPVAVGRRAAVVAAPLAALHWMVELLNYCETAFQVGAAAIGRRRHLRVEAYRPFTPGAAVRRRRSRGNLRVRSRPPTARVAVAAVAAGASLSLAAGASLSRLTVPEMDDASAVTSTFASASGASTAFSRLSREPRRRSRVSPRPFHRLSASPPRVWAFRSPRLGVSLAPATPRV